MKEIVKRTCRRKRNLEQIRYQIKRSIIYFDVANNVTFS